MWTTNLTSLQQFLTAAWNENESLSVNMWELPRAEKLEFFGVCDFEIGWSRTQNNTRESRRL